MDKKVFQPAIIRTRTSFRSQKLLYPYRKAPVYLSPSPPPVRLDRLDITPPRPPGKLTVYGPLGAEEGEGTVHV